MVITAWEAWREAPFGQSTVEKALLVNPAGAAMSALRAEGFTDYNLIPGNWWFLGVASVVCLIVLPDCVVGPDVAYFASAVAR